MPNVFEQNTFEKAKALLKTCHRGELRDHAFGDREVFWMQGETEVASGYFGGTTQEVYIHEEFGGGSFQDHEALELAEQGSDVIITRNDETGPDYYGGP
jgi:hypothetical protein